MSPPRAFGTAENQYRGQQLNSSSEINSVNDLNIALRSGTAEALKNMLGKQSIKIQGSGEDFSKDAENTFMT